MGHIVLFVDGSASFLHWVTCRDSDGALQRVTMCAGGKLWSWGSGGIDADVCGRYGGVHARRRFSALESTLGRSQPVPRTVAAPTAPPHQPRGATLDKNN